MTEDKASPALLNQHGDNTNNNNVDPVAVVPNEEIVASNPSQKSWKGILIAIVVILAISGVIILAIYLTSPDSTSKYMGEKFTFNNGFLGKAITKHMQYEWVGDNVLSYMNESYSRNLLFLNNMTEINMKIKTYLEEKQSSESSVKISSDLKYFIISYKMSKNFRYSRSAQHTVFNMNDYRSSTDIGQVPDQALQNVGWSPKTHILTYIYENHLYINDDPLNNNKIQKITEKFSSHNDIKYGISDWLYEEEILKVSKAYWWSPEETYLVFLEFDDTKVDTYKIKVYGDQTDLNGDTMEMKYPKAGKTSNNPTVKVHIFTYRSKKFNTISKPDQIPNDYYISMVKWIGDKKLFIAWMNREQTHYWFTISTEFGSNSGPKTWVIFDYSRSDGWINVLKQNENEPLFSKDENSLFLILDRVTFNNTYRNIARLKINNVPGNRATKDWVAVGDFDFSQLISYDGNEILFTAPLKNDPKEMHLYRNTIGSHQVSCITCKINNSNCTYYKFSANSWNPNFMIQSCLGPQIPKYTLISKASNGSLIEQKVLIENKKLHEFLRKKSLPRIKYERLTININKTATVDLEMRMYLPNTLNPKHVTKYPMLLIVYGGPGSQMVTKKFDTIRWKTYLASSLGVIVLEVDGRGTKMRGRAFETAVYKRLGDVEIHDQLKAVQAVVKKYKFINESAVGAFGWSYGGFVVGHLLGHRDNDVIRCGVSVAPVTNFEYYDTAYTERYLGLKANDRVGIYKQTDIASAMSNMEGKEYLLVHGTKDDNVHFMNTAMLIKSLIEKQIMFDVMAYPDRSHQLMGGYTHMHVYKKVTMFLMNCFNRSSVHYRLPLFT